LRDFFFFLIFYLIFVVVTHPSEIELLFKEHYEQLHRYAFTILKDTDEAKDVVQAVFLNLWEKRETLNITSSPKAYLFRSVYNESLNHIKKQEVLNRHHNLSGAVTPGEDEQKPFAFEDELFLKQKIENVMLELPPQCREVFTKSRAEQKKYSEIAAEMGIAVKTVEAHMSKALKLIRKIVGVLVVLACLYIDFI
jgi:RNA polymerase sigma-70 factor (ECF subfamily)